MRRGNGEAQYVTMSLTITYNECHHQVSVDQDAEGGIRVYAMAVQIYKACRVRQGDNNAAQCCPSHGFHKIGHVV